ncbi:MAG: Sulfhydrogenase 1 subunit alpha [Candidatus Woesearchaeota archaeon]|nr:Sulfhydrogenase 1 subunit alpha [Candidatus Woesearchaeota archaeon]
MKTVKLDHITKIEGHAKLHLVIDNNKIKKLKLGAFEGARYFEGLIVGRKQHDVPIITSRICGICSCIHVTASVQAVEAAFGIKASQQTKKLRELMVIGERIRSHASHLYLFALPDYLGFESSIAMAPKHKKEVNQALELIKLGNNIVTTIGAREMHPVATVPGGFTALPKQEELSNLLKRLKQQRKQAISTAKLFASLDYPEFENKTQYLALDDNGYSNISGNIVSQDQKINSDDYLKHITEKIIEYSTAKFSTLNKKPFMVGSLARLNNHFNTVSKDTQKLIEKFDLQFPIHNPFYNNLCQALEMVHHFDEATEILENLKIKPEQPAELKNKSGRGVSAVEAPRGLLFHDYTFENGKIKHANIITPTAQNLNNLEFDLWKYVPALLKLSEPELKFEIEKLIRAYDPCFSCSAHFLQLKLER